MIRFIRTALDDFVDLLFPTLCLGCTNSLGANEKVLCTKCRISLPETNQHIGLYDQNLFNKFAGKVPVHFLASYLFYSKGGIVQKLIYGIKYKGQKEVAKEVASWYGYQLLLETTLVKDIDVLIGVPLHKSRFQQRGYNQADCIAEGLSEALNIPMRTDVLLRNQFKESQTRKNRLERWQNVRTVFSVQNERDIENKNVAIVDDVLTTGSTVEACAIELLRAGCKSVSVLTLASTYR